MLMREKARIVINVKQTQYDVVKKAARLCNWRLKYLTEDCDGAIIDGNRNQNLSSVYDITWHDTAVSCNFFSKLFSY